MSSAGREDGFPTAAAFLPRRPTLKRLRDNAAGCRGCPLWERATQTVFGEGPADARVVLVGEQPGDAEDLAGHPFVGPAGHLLDRALDEAGLPRGTVYVTNAVKHFRFKETSGKRRLHDKPRPGEVRACRPWLEAELKLVAPRVIVCLGATAAQSLMGPAFRVTRQRGVFLPCPWAEWLVATVHPSALLRMPDHDAREAAFAELVRDLAAVARKARNS